MDIVVVSTVAGATVAVVGGIGGAVVAVTRPLRRLSRQMDQLRVDWYGEAARAGFDARPGIPERLRKIEKELSPNGGSSARDAIGRIELNQNRLTIDHGILARRVDDHLRQIEPALAELSEWQRVRATLMVSDVENRER